VSGGALNSTQSNPSSNNFDNWSIYDDVVKLYGLFFGPPRICAYDLLAMY